MTSVACPCCHGERVLYLHEPGTVEFSQIIDCCHCQGEGLIQVEIEDTTMVNIDKMNLWAKARQWLRS